MVLQFLFETFTDLSVVPSLFLIFQRQKHFEFAMGIFQFVVSLLYNVCDSLDVTLFLDKTEWHQLTNVAGLAYGVNVLVYLMCNTSEAQDHVLRYTAFFSLWIAQLKDRFWMEHTVTPFFFFFFCHFFIFCAAIHFARDLRVPAFCSREGLVSAKAHLGLVSL
jgi:hypothetical protein